MLEASISIQQIDERRWELICRALMRLEKENGVLLEMKRLRIKEENSCLKFIYNTKEKTQHIKETLRKFAFEEFKQK